MGVKKAGPYIDKFMKEHNPISKYLCKSNSIGLKLMFKDAAIAVDVINHFVKQGIPILSMHDSFIIEKSYKKELKNIMFKTYCKHCKFSIDIK